jgi:hypothetical protein
MEKVRNSSELPMNDQILLEFALGKAYLGAEDYDAAIDAFLCGNRLKRQSLRFSVGFDERRVQDLIKRFDKETLRKPLRDANTSERPIFIVGMPRSGTTLVEQILSAHSQVFGAGELDVIGRLAFNSTSSNDDQIGDRYIAVVSQLAGSERYITDKLPLNFFHIGIIRQHLPNARIIHCVRDPVDTGLSCFMTLFDLGHEFSYSLDDIGRFSLAHQRLMNHWRPLLDPQTFLEINYESLVRNVEAETRRLLDFCDLDWQGAVLEFERNTRIVRTASKMQVRRKMYADSVGRSAKFGSKLEPLRQALRLPANDRGDASNIVTLASKWPDGLASAIEAVKRELLVDVAGICAVVLIGSTATGRRFPSSDIDLLVLTMAPFNQFRHIVRCGFEFDVQVYSLLYASRAFLENSDYMQHSVRVGICIWEENASWTTLRSQAPLMRAPRGSIEELDPKLRAYFQRAPLRLLEVYRQSKYADAVERQIALDGMLHELLTACYRMHNKYPPKAPNRLSEFFVDFSEWSGFARAYIGASDCESRLRALEELADAMVHRAGGPLKEYIGPVVWIC